MSSEDVNSLRVIDLITSLIADSSLRLMLPKIYMRIKQSIKERRAEIRQVLVNLIQNAIKYTETGSVIVTVEEEKKSVKISVQDTGIGIKAKNQDRIFERFYRVDKGRSRAEGGTGLGLAIVKHIVEAHESKIEVKSEPGKGSEFSFRLKISSPGTLP